MLTDFFAELLQELERLVDQIDEATEREQASTSRAEAAERQIRDLETKLAASQVHCLVNSPHLCPFDS